MNRASDVKQILESSTSASFRRLNGLPDLRRAGVEAVEGKAKRVRQKSGDGMNKLERDLYETLRRANPEADITPHGLTLVLGNGVRYNPDLLVDFRNGSKPRFYEAKGPHAWEDSIVKLKIAPRQHRWAEFFLAWRVQGVWRFQEILP